MTTKKLSWDKVGLETLFLLEFIEHCNFSGASSHPEAA